MQILQPLQNLLGHPRRFPLPISPLLHYISEISRGNLLQNNLHSSLLLVHFEVVVAYNVGVRESFKQPYFSLEVLDLLHCLLLGLSGQLYYLHGVGFGCVYVDALVDSP